MSSAKRSPAVGRRRRSTSFKGRVEPKPSLATKSNTGSEAPLIVTPSNEDEIREQVQRLIGRGSPDPPRHRNMLRRSGSSLVRMRLSKPDSKGKSRERGTIADVQLAADVQAKEKGRTARKARAELRVGNLRVLYDDSAIAPLAVPLEGASVKGKGACSLVVAAASGSPSVKVTFDMEPTATAWAAALAGACGAGAGAEGLEQARRVEALAQRRENAACADCGAAGVEHAAPALGIFICAACASVHRTLGTRLVALAGPWEEADAAAMEACGNRRANAEWAFRVPGAATLEASASRCALPPAARRELLFTHKHTSGARPQQWLRLTQGREARVKHLHAKYVQRTFHREAEAAADSGLSAEFVRQALLEALDEDAEFRAGVRALLYPPA